MKRIKVTLAALLCSTFFSVAYNPDDIISQIVESNPSLATLTTQADADAKAAYASNSLSGPELEFEHLWGRDGATKWSVGVSQSFEWPSLYKVRKDLAYLNYVSATLSVNVKKSELINQARETLVRLYYCQQRLDILDGLIADMSSLHNHLGEALGHGLITILDYKKSGLELTELQIERSKVVDEQHRLEASLNELAGKPLHFPDGRPEAPAFIGTLNSLDSYTAEIRTNSPAVAFAESNLAIAKLNVNNVSKSNAPGFSVGYRHAKEEGIHYNGFAIGIELPTWGINRNKAAVQSAELSAQTACDEAIQAETARVESEYRVAESLRSEINALRANGLDGSYVSLLKEAYNGGEISVLDYLREQSYYQSSRLSILDLEEQYAVSLTSLNRYASLQ